MCISHPMANIHAQTPMKDVLSTYPGARRALFAEYHIGGCSSCAYQENESLLGVCERNEIKVEDAIEHILNCHQSDQKMLISPEQAKKLLDADSSIILLDTRSREEHEAVAIPGSEFMTQERQTEIFAKTPPETTIILFDHSGSTVLDTCSWFVGHQMKNTRALEGGIDAWSQQIDSSIARYRLEME